MLVHTYNLSTWETEIGGLQICGQPGLLNDFQAYLNYIVSLQKKKKRILEDYWILTEEL